MRQRALHLTSVLLATFLFGCAPKPRPVAPTTRTLVHLAPAVPSCGSGQLRVHFYDVAQALAALVDLPDGRHILVDTGDDPRRPGCGVICKNANAHLLDRLGHDLNRQPISLVWITHQHSDHIGGASSVLEHFEVAGYVDNGRNLEKNQIKRTHASAEERQTAIYTVDPSHRDVPLTTEAPLTLSAIVPTTWPSDCDGDPNECSIGLRIDYCASSVLFSGDAEEGEEAVLDSHGAVTLLQLGHHGSDTSSSEDFIARTTPKYAVVSAGKRDEGLNRTYCHPRESTVRRVMEKIGGAPTGTIAAFDASVSCNADDADSHWVDVPTSANFWATERDGDVVLVTSGDGEFHRQSSP